jgi:hypothetical protein
MHYFFKEKRDYWGYLWVNSLILPLTAQAEWWTLATRL